MGYLNFPPNLKDIFDDIYARVRKLETAQRFTAPVVAADPANTRKGDIWLNTTTNSLKTYDNNGAVESIDLTPIAFTPVLTAQTGTITSYTINYCSYVRIGKLCSVHFTVTITNAGTGANALFMTLPFNSAGSSAGAVRENAVVGSEGQVWTQSGINYAPIMLYNSTTPIVTNYQLIGTLNYITA